MEFGLELGNVTTLVAFLAFTSAGVRVGVGGVGVGGGVELSSAG